MSSHEFLGFRASDLDLRFTGAHMDLDSSESFKTERSSEELIELSLEHSVSHELLLGVDAALLNLIFFLVLHLIIIKLNQRSITFFDMQSLSSSPFLPSLNNSLKSNLQL